MEAREVIETAEKQIEIFERPSMSTSQELIDQLKIALQRNELVNIKFTSGNDIEVERITVRRDEWFID